MLKKAVSLLAALAMGVSSIVMAAPVFAADGYQEYTYTHEQWNQTVTISDAKVEKQTLNFSVCPGDMMDDVYVTVPAEVTVVSIKPGSQITGYLDGAFYRYSEKGWVNNRGAGGLNENVLTNWLTEDGTMTSVLTLGTEADLEEADPSELVFFKLDGASSGSSGPDDTAGPSGPSDEGPSGPSFPADTSGPSEPSAPTSGNTSSGGSSASGDVQYTVKQWDTLGHLSVNYYGNYNYHQAIYDANKEAFAKTGGKVVPGMVLTLPAKIGDAEIIAPTKAAPGEKLYTVKSGDTLGAIAANYYGSTKKYQEIFERNKDRLKDAVTLYEGQIIVLPKVTGKWQKSGDNWNYVLDTGKKLAGRWQWIDGSWYRFNNNGVMVTGWYKDTAKDWYYLQANGAMLANGWYTIGEKEYYLNADGAMETGWLRQGNTWYYLQPKTGEKVSGGWQKIDGEDYYFYADGSMAANTTIDGYTVGGDGAWVK